MSVEQMRNHILMAYSGDNWKKKVNKMPDVQVIAIYHKIIKKEEKA